MISIEQRARNKFPTLIMEDKEYNESMTEKQKEYINFCKEQRALDIDRASNEFDTFLEEIAKDKNLNADMVKRNLVAWSSNFKDSLTKYL